jgi:hypothetical protein
MNFKNNTSSDNVLLPSVPMKQEFRTVANDIGSGPPLPAYLNRVGRYNNSPPQIAVHIPKPA